MTELILHHYAISVFSERVRLALGLKRLSWRSVSIPHMMPKPDLMPLTGGYRRTPVLQIGADIYCDTLLILRKIEALYPEPTLYPGGIRGDAQEFGVEELLQCGNQMPGSLVANPLTVIGRLTAEGSLDSIELTDAAQRLGSDG